MSDYCTLFDSNYLSRGLLMYESLMHHQPAAHLYIFPFDDQCYSVLKSLNLRNVTLVPLSEFENETLLQLKKVRTRTEYCWTCTPSIVDYVLTVYGAACCTYVDADLYFYGDPTILLNEVPVDYSVLITAHRYTKEYDQSSTSGIYCVQFITFRNNPNGLSVLAWWKNACIEWCFNIMENGKFGDQKYLDDWPERFKGIVWELKHTGGGVAPWNVQQYRFEKTKGKIIGLELLNNEKFDLIFYHFHATSFQLRQTPLKEFICLKYVYGYEIPVDCMQVIYRNYAKKLVLQSLALQEKYGIDIRISTKIHYGFFSFLKYSLKNLVHKNLWQG